MVYDNMEFESLNIPFLNFELDKGRNFVLCAKDGGLLYPVDKNCHNYKNGMVFIENILVVATNEPQIEFNLIY